MSTGMIFIIVGVIMLIGSLLTMTSGGSGEDMNIGLILFVGGILAILYGTDTLNILIEYVQNMGS